MLAVGELLRHVEKELTVPLIDAAEKPFHLIEKAQLPLRLFVQRQFFRRLPLAQIRQGGRFIALEEKLIEWELKGRRDPLQRFDGRDGMPILHSGDVTAQEACPLFDITLRKLSFLSESS